MFMVLSSWQSHCESSPGSFDECRTAPSGRRPSDRAKRLRLWDLLNRMPESTPTIAIYYYYSARKLITFYRLTDDRSCVDLVGWLHTEMTYPPIDGHQSWYSNHVRPSATTLIEANTLPLSQTANQLRESISTAEFNVPLDILWVILGTILQMS